MAEIDFQTPGLHLNYNIVLPHELRVWTTNNKERWEYHDVEALRNFLAFVLAEMSETKEENRGE